MFTNNLRKKIPHNALGVEASHYTLHTHIQINRPRAGIQCADQIIQTFTNTLTCAHTHFGTHMCVHVYK